MGSVLSCLRSRKQKGPVNSGANIPDLPLQPIIPPNRAGGSTEQEEMPGGAADPGMRGETASIPGSVSQIPEANEENNTNRADEFVSRNEGHDDDAGIGIRGETSQIPEENITNRADEYVSQNEGHDDDTGIGMQEETASQMPRANEENIINRADESASQNEGHDDDASTGMRGETASQPEATEEKVSKRSRNARIAAEGLKLALTVAERALEGFPIPGVQGSIAAVLKLIEVAERASSNVDTLRHLHAHVDFLSTNALEPLRSLHNEDDIPDGMMEDVKRLVQALKEVTSKWESRTQRGSIRRWIEATADEKELTEFSVDVKQAVELFQFTSAVRGRLADHRQEKKLQDIYASQKALHEESVFLERARLVRELQPAKGAFYDSGKLNNHSTCFEGTRIEVIREIMSWLEADDTPSSAHLFWLNGLAGIGKSTIAKTVAGLVHDKGILGGSFFFSRGDEQLTNPTLVFPTLAFQLAHLDKSLMSSIGQALESDASCASASVQIQLQKLIVEPMEASFSSTSLKRVIFVIDALDECRNEERTGKIVMLLLSHLKRIPYARVLLTSRPEPHILRAFKDGDDLSIYILHDIEKAIVQDDIRLYLRETLKIIASEHVLSPEIKRTAPSWPREDDIEILVQMSGALFIYAATAVRFIKMLKKNPMRQMEILLGVLHVKKSNPYEQLDKLYLEILRNGVSAPDEEVNEDYDEDVNEDMVQFRRVVGTLVLLRNPLSLNALSAITEVPLVDVINTLTYMQSIIIMPTSDNLPPQIYHPSFRDFLMSANRCSDPQYVIKIPSMEKWLTLRCLNLLMQGRHLQRDILGLGEDALMNEYVNDLDMLLESAFPQEVRYACLYWSSHLHLVEHGDKDVVQALYGFASRHLLFWFEAMSLLKQRSRAITVMREAHAWAEHTSHQQLKALLYDGYRFALSHQATMEAGALQVYHSALPFTPHDTLLYETYAFEEAQSLHVLHGVPAQWSPCLASLQGGHGGIKSTAYSHDGTSFALGFNDPFVTVRTSSGDLLSTFEYSDPQEVLCLTFLPGDRYLIAGTTTGTVSQWSILTALLVRSFEGHLSSATCVAVCVKTPTAMASASLDATIRLWNVANGDCTCVLSCRGSPVHAVAFTSDGTRLLSGSEDGVVRIWDVSTPSASKEVRAVSAHESGIGTLAISPKGDSYCTGGDDHLVKIFAMGADVPTYTLTDHAEKVIWLTYTADGETLLSVGHDERHVRLWNTSDGVLRGLSRGYVTQAAFSPNGEQLVTASTDGICRIWTGKNASPTIDPIDHSDWIISVVFSLDGKMLATAGNQNDRNVKIWDAIAGTLRYTLRGHRWAIYSLAFSEDGSMLASGDGDATVCIWDVASGDLLFNIPGHDNWIQRVQFTKNGLNLISRTPNTTYTWDLSTRDSDASEEENDSLLLGKQSEHNEGDPSYMSGSSQGYHFSMGDAHRVFMGKGERDSQRLVGAVQEEYRITGFAFHTDRVAFGCTDGSLLILDVSRLKPRLG